MIQFLRKDEKRKENKMKCMISKPSHANLFAASDRSNPLDLATHGHGDLRDGSSPRCVLHAKLSWGGKSRTSPPESSSLPLNAFQNLDASVVN